MWENVLCFSLQADIPYRSNAFQDLFVCDKDLFVEAKPQWGSINGGSNAARKSGKDDYDKLSLPAGSGFPEDFLQ